MLSDRERAEFDRLGVTLGGCGCAGDAGGGCANDAPVTLDALPEKQLAEVWDWALMRKFNAFWPSTMSGPHAFPWLGELVTRDRAWRWASQFPTFFATIEASDSDVILAFIARTLTEVEPPSRSDAMKSKGCCKKRTSDEPYNCCAEKRATAEAECVGKGGLNRETFSCRNGPIGGAQEGGCFADWRCNNGESGESLLPPDSGPDDPIDLS